MRTTKKKPVVKPSKKNFLKTVPAVVFILGFLLTLFLIDLYKAINAKNNRQDHTHPVNEHANKKNQ